MAYEGLEQSPNIVYTGAAPNQQITPAVQWCHEKLGARRFFLVGSDYVWPHCVNAIIGDQLAALGAEKVAEAYIPFGSMDVAAAVRAIVETKPDVVLCSVVGDSALAFAQALRQAGVDPVKTPVLTFALGENELHTMPLGSMVGNYASWSYFQSIDRPENVQFVNAFKARYGRDRTVQDVMETAYFSVKLWAQAVREADNTDVRPVRYALRRQSMNAPEGTIAVDPQTQHTWRPVSIGRIRTDGQFEIVWRSRTAVRPVPFPSSRSRDVWEKFVLDLYHDWGGQWIAPAASPTRVAPALRETPAP
jgi:urea transport system substrate-binding protein